MIVSIAKDFWWEMSHRLPFHDGPCRNVHGHTYKLRLELTGSPDDCGILLDYYHMQEVVQPVLSLFDHSFLCDENDSLMIGFLRENGFKYYIMKKNSTSENIAELLGELLVEKFRQFRNLTSMEIKIYETADVYAAARFDLK